MTVSTKRLAEVFVEVADTLIDEFDLIEFLQMLADRVAGLTDDATVGILLADPKPRLHFMAASAESAKFLELFQLQHQDGPCVDAFHSGQPVINTDLTAATATARWPRFAPYAADAGYRSVHAFPLRLRREIIGAMGVFGTTVGDLNDSDVQIVQALADVAAISLLQERVIRRGEILTEQLQGALNSRIIIEQAKGAIAQTHGIDVDAAYELIRGYARNNNRRLGDVAHTVVTDPASLPGLADPGVRVVRIAGEVDMDTAPQITDAVRAALAARPREVHVDLAAVTFIDSAGIRTLLQAQDEAAEQGVVLRVVNAHPRVVDVLDLTGLLDLLQDGTVPD